MLSRYLCVLVGGGVGSLCRYLVGRAILQAFPTKHFPLGTLLINISGSFMIGLLMTVLVERFRLPQFWQLLLVVGFLGGYTTFSSFEYDTYLAIRSGRIFSGLSYILASVSAGYVAVWLGVTLVRR